MEPEDNQKKNENYFWNYQIDKILPFWLSMIVITFNGCFRFGKTNVIETGKTGAIYVL